MKTAPAKTNREAIIRARRRKGWTQTRLAREAGYSPSLISRIESGAVQGLPQTVLAIATALDVDVDAITSDDELERVA